MTKGPGRFWRFLVLAACLADLTGPPAAAQAQAPVSPRPGPPTSRDEFDDLFDAVIRSADVVAAETRNKEQIREEARQVLAAIATHNQTEPNRSDAAAVARYNGERKALDDRRLALLARRSLNDGALGNARTHLQILMARLRLVSVLAELEPWRRRIVACADLPDAMQAAACLKRVWEQMPRIRPRR